MRGALYGWSWEITSKKSMALFYAFSRDWDKLLVRFELQMLNTFEHEAGAMIPLATKAFCIGHILNDSDV
ncbi:MAG: hypothetical protein CMQ20_10795 [Gammaproteobacteria bacterium]|jgi:hypothetical protein|nr:hypothetical protein [Gammaproteobacteria bacterium]|tara:strand:- start:1272 stop:1481 length:210 start_codon:yes stop_codon:yes gene_type:complete